MRESLCMGGCEQRSFPSPNSETRGAPRGFGGLSAQTGPRNSLVSVVPTDAVVSMAKGWAHEDPRGCPWPSPRGADRATCCCTRPPGSQAARERHEGRNGAPPNRGSRGTPPAPPRGAPARHRDCASAWAAEARDEAQPTGWRGGRRGRAREASRGLQQFTHMRGLRECPRMRACA